MLLRILKNVFKALMITIIICIALIGIIGFIIYFDSARLNKALEGDKTLLMWKDNKIVAGVKINTLSSQNNILTNGLFTSYDEAKLIFYEEKIDDKNYKEENNLILIINVESFTGLEKVTLDEKQIILTKEKLSKIIESKNVGEIIEALLENENFTTKEKQKAKSEIESKFDTAQELKNTIFINIFVEDIKSDGLSFIVMHANNGNLQAKPEFITLKLLKYIPNKAMEKIISKE